MIRTLILEDNTAARDLLASFLSRYAQENDLAIDVVSYADPYDFLESYQGKADVIFFDIEMPGMNGMEVAKKIREQDDQALFVFVTNLAQYAIEGYSVQAFDFILKPINYPSFCLKLSRIVGELNHRKNDASITLQSKGKFARVHIAELWYVEVRNHNLVYHVASQENVTLRGTMEKAVESLSSYHFTLCNASFLINLAHVKGIEDNSVLVETERLPISKSKHKDFLQALARYYGGVD